MSDLGEKYESNDICRWSNVQGVGSPGEVEWLRRGGERELFETKFGKFENRRFQLSWHYIGRNDKEINVGRRQAQSIFKEHLRVKHRDRLRRVKECCCIKLIT